MIMMKLIKKKIFFHFFCISTTIGCDNRLRNNKDCGAALLIRMENDERKTYLALMWFYA